jgi:hypothetical protein
MPSWSIHLKVAKDINKELGLDKDLFLLGNTIPDVGKNWDITKRKSHYYSETRFPECPDELLIDIDEFLNDYQFYLDDPLVMGYYVHLLVDNYFNRYTYTKKYVQKDGKVLGYTDKDGNLVPMEGQQDRMHVKQHDFELFGKELFKEGEVEVPQHSKEYVNSMRYFYFLEPNLVYDRVEYLNNEFKDFNKIEEGDDYKMYSREELENVLKGCEEHILGIIKGKDNDEGEVSKGSRR